MQDRKKIKLENQNEESLHNIKLGRQFFDVPCCNLANFLLGKVLVRKLSNTNLLKGLIVETECYLGGEDKASHSYNGRKTPGNEPMYMQPGTAYVYMTYGMYFCFNISTSEPGGAVLIRAVQPLEGIDTMRTLRSGNSRCTNNQYLKDEELCNGPAKLCMSMDITKESCNKLDLCNSDCIWIEEQPNLKLEPTISTSRIGIESAGEEWSNKPLRFYVYGNKSVSKRDRTAERTIDQ